MSYLDTNSTQSEWKEYEKILFRFFFAFFALLAVPLDCKFYINLFSIDWTALHVYDLLQLTRYSPQFISEASLPKWGIASFSNWGIAVLISLLATGIWSYFDKERKEYKTLLYWLRVILRYRLAIGIIAYGFIKLFPLQIPYPSLSNLHTNYGDFFGWKIYWHTIGIVPGYESFLGLVEIIAGFLLFNRKTVTFGTGLIIGFTGNVLAANLAYDAGDHVYSAYLVIIAFFLFSYDIPRLWNLLALEKKTIANKFTPEFKEEWLKKTRLSLRVAFLFFVVLFGFRAYSNFVNDPYLIPKTPGLKDAYGFYNVKHFVLNKDTIPYSNTDPNRWQNVVFEKWATISVKIARPIKIDLTNGDVAAKNDIDRNFESAGVGGRHYFAYEADTVNQTLSLQNKNKNHQDERLFLTYKRPNDSTIVISGVNEKKDSVYATLERITRKYMLFEGRRKPVKL